MSGCFYTTIVLPTAGGGTTTATEYPNRLMVPPGGWQEL